jgi:hypothetical protein
MSSCVSHLLGSCYLVLACYTECVQVLTVNHLGSIPRWSELWG